MFCLNINILRDYFKYNQKIFYLIINKNRENIISYTYTVLKLSKYMKTSYIVRK